MAESIKLVIAVPTAGRVPMGLLVNIIMVINIGMLMANYIEMMMNLLKQKLAAILKY